MAKAGDDAKRIGGKPLLPSKTPQAVLQRLPKHEAERLHTLSARLAGAGDVGALSSDEMKEFERLTGGVNWLSYINPANYVPNRWNNYLWPKVFERYNNLKLRVATLASQFASPDLPADQKASLYQELSNFDIEVSKEIAALQVQQTRVPTSTATFVDMSRLEAFEKQFNALETKHAQFVAAARAFKVQQIQYPPQAVQALLAQQGPQFAPQQPIFAPQQPQQAQPLFAPQQPQPLFSPQPALQFQQPQPLFSPQPAQQFQQPQPLFSPQPAQQFQSLFAPQQPFAQQPFASPQPSFGQQQSAAFLQQQYSEFLRQQQLQRDAMLAQQMAQQEELAALAQMQQMSQQQQPSAYYAPPAPFGPSPFGPPSPAMPAPNPFPSYAPLPSYASIGNAPAAFAPLPSYASIGNQTIFAGPDPGLDPFVASPAQMFSS